MIVHLKYNQIDFNKYDTCIKNAINNRIYAYSWYLDIVTNKNWEVLVLDDYKFVMPLPFSRIKKKFLKRMVSQPLFCQQLGVFSKVEITLDTMQFFVEKLKKFSIDSYHFNAENLIKSTKKPNFELALIDYKLLAKNYTKGLLENLKKATKNNLKLVKTLSFNDFKKLKIENSYHKITKSNFKKMEGLTATIITKNQGDFFGVYYNEQLIAISFLVITNNRIIYLFSTANKVGKKVGATAFLLNETIKNNCNKNIVLDFEGSQIEGVAKFFKSFGAENNSYFVVN